MDNRYTTGAYLEKNPDWHVLDSPWKARQIATILTRNGVLPGTVSEIGCGAGGILTNLCSLLPETVTFSGYDISPQAHAICKEKATDRISFYQEDFFTSSAPNSDVLLAIDVVEHVEDYFTFLRKLRDKATHKVIHVPLELACHRVLRGKPLMDTRTRYGHIQYFNKDIFLAVLAETGYDVTDYIYTPLSTSSEVNREKTLSTRLANVVRRTFFNRFPDLTARAIGGYSLLVLAK